MNLIRHYKVDRREVAVARMKEIHIDVDVNRVIEANRTSFAEKENDILRRLLLEPRGGAQTGSIYAVTQPEVPNYGSRSRGHWQVKFGDELVVGANLKDAYCYLLHLAHQRDSGFLQQFSTYKARSRRYVARSGPELYLNSPHLARQHAIELVPGWFVDGNLSEEQVGKRARAAALAAGLFYGTDVWIKDQGRTI